MVVGFCWVLLFLFVPETFWDRTPRPKSRHTSKNNSGLSVFRQRLASHVSHYMHPHPKSLPASHQVDGSSDAPLEKTSTSRSTAESVLRRPSQVHRPARSLHVGFASEDHEWNEKSDSRESYNGHASPSNGQVGPIAAIGTTPLETPSSGEILHYL